MTYQERMMHNATHNTITHYERLIVDVINHLDEWHTNDGNGKRSCDFDSTCILNSIQESANEARKRVPWTDSLTTRN